MERSAKPSYFLDRLVFNLSRAFLHNYQDILPLQQFVNGNSEMITDCYHTV